MTGKNESEKLSKRVIISYFLAFVFLVGLGIWEVMFHDTAINNPIISKSMILLSWVFVIYTLLELRKRSESLKKYRDELIKLNATRDELERISKSYLDSETGTVDIKNFNYLLNKISMLLEISQTRQNKLSDITFMSQLKEETLIEGQLLSKLSEKFSIGFEWYITEQTTQDNRINLRNQLLKVVSGQDSIYLTGESTMFDKLLFIQGVIIIIFIKNMWFCWNLNGINVDIEKIREKIVLTPFSRKLDQFFGKAEVHSAISCYLSKIIAMEGFMVGAEHSYFWIKEPSKLFEDFTRYQEFINEKFEEVSDELRPISTRITANLPLLDNYKGIINDPKVEEWLSELKEETQNRGPSKKKKGSKVLELNVDRYIYISGKISDGKWVINDGGYLNEICEFLKKDFFSDLPESYMIWIVLCDIDKMTELYKNYKTSTDTIFPYGDILSNWIWFECQSAYHVLQYERGLKVERLVAEALAPVLNKDVSQLEKISTFMFADVINPDSQEIMKKYHDYKGYLEHCRKTPVVMSHTNFLSKYCAMDQK